MLVQDLQHAVRVELIIVAALDLHGLAGQGHGVHGVEIALHQLGAEIDQVADGQVGADIGRKQLGIVLHLRQRYGRGQLQRQRAQKFLLRSRTLNVHIGSAAAVAAQLQRMCTVKQLMARLQVDVDVLVVIVILQVGRDIEFHAADHVDCLFKALQINQHITVDCNGKRLADLIGQRTDAAVTLARRAVDGIDLRNDVIAGDISVARDAHQADGVLLCVEICDQERIRAGAVAIRANKQDVVDSLMAGGVRHIHFDALASLCVRLNADARAAAGLVIPAGRSDGRRAAEQRQTHGDGAEKQRDGGQQKDQAARFAVHATARCFVFRAGKIACQIFVPRRFPAGLLRFRARCTRSRNALRRLRNRSTLRLLCRRARLLRLRRSLMPLLWHGLRQRRALQILLQKRVIILFRLRTVLRRLAVGIITQERDLVLV